MSSLAKLLNLASSPVAVAFVADAPVGVPHVSTGEPASCGYWSRAAAGEVFYTIADDHKGCPIGAHTHNAPLSPIEKEGLAGLIGTMIGLEYLKVEDVPAIPTRLTALQVAVYAPVDRTPVSPDVILVRGNARQLMLLAEAALVAGVTCADPTMGRPTCAIIPKTIDAGCASSSFGCIGNRVYTNTADDEAWFGIPGDDLQAVEEKLAVILVANAELEKFHRDRARA